MKLSGMKLLIAALLLTCGCAERTAVVRSYGSSIRSDVFTEMAARSTAAPGTADLAFVATIKTHRPGAHYTLDNHGTPEYKLLLNIDGQALLITGLLQEVNEPVRVQDPEGGEGIRYRFSKSLRLRPGKHTIVIALPEDDIVIEKEITLNDGAVTNLVLEPMYYSEPGKKVMQSAGTFTQGIRGFRFSLNGEQI
jgi:hypothetical protein